MAAPARPTAAEVLEIYRKLAPEHRHLVGTLETATNDEKDASKAYLASHVYEEGNAARELAEDLGKTVIEADDAQLRTQEQVKKDYTALKNLAKQKLFQLLAANVAPSSKNDSQILRSQSDIKKYGSIEKALDAFVTINSINQHYPTFCTDKFSTLVFYLTRRLVEKRVANALARIQSCHDARLKENQLSPNSGDALHVNIVTWLEELHREITANTGSIDADSRVVYYEYTNPKRTPVGFRLTKDPALPITPLGLTVSCDTEANAVSSKTAGLTRCPAPGGSRKRHRTFRKARRMRRKGTNRKVLR